MKAMQRTPHPTFLQEPRAWWWPAGALFGVFAATFIPTIGAWTGAPLASLAIGGAAAWWRLRTMAARGETGTLAQAAAAGAITGIGAFAASLIAFTIVGFFLGSAPGIQEFVSNSEPHPEARISYEWLPRLGAATGALVGSFAGLFNLALSTFGGLLAGLVSSPRPGGLSRSCWGDSWRRA